MFDIQLADCLNFNSKVFVQQNTIRNDIFTYILRFEIMSIPCTCVTLLTRSS